MTIRTWGIVVLVAMLNVTMNVALKHAARTKEIAAMLRLPSLWIALGSGTSSIALLIVLYRSNVGLARVLLALGATSVLIGAGTGALRGERLTRLEVGILCALVVFSVAAWARRA